MVLLIGVTLYEKFNWDIGIEEYVKDVKIVEAFLRSAEPHWYHYWDLPDRERNLAVCYYLLGDLQNSRTYAARLVSHSLDYFYGAWRLKLKTQTGEGGDAWRNVSWISPFREAICFASSLPDWASLQRLAEYPNQQCRPDPGCTKEDKALYFALASYLRGDSRDEIQRFFEVIQRGKKQKPKLVAEVIRALQDKSTEAFQESLEAYLRYFRKSEFKKKDLGNLLCFDGTTVLNIGERKGLSFKVPPELEDHIIRLK